MVHDGVKDAAVDLRHVIGGAGTICRSILDLLPSWFGIPEAVDDYVRTARTEPSIIASVAGVDIGITTIKLHSQYAAEVYLMAVHPAYHRRGVGRAMLVHLERNLATRGVEYLQVKTLSASRPDPGYDKTRAFYLAYGFRPLEEFPALWDPSNPALQLVKSVPAN
jgi:GNAT superfamily N-acetyltransferase